MDGEYNGRRDRAKHEAEKEGDVQSGPRRILKNGVWIGVAEVG